jgi:hypothetical protein
MATINHKTYNEATETFKDFSVYDGKETLIFKVDGSEGNVGIGTSSPAGKLDITGGNGDQLLLNNAGERFTQISFTNNSNLRAAVWADETNNDFVLYAASGRETAIYANAAERVRITTTGNVGINTSAPTNLLHLAGASATPSLRLGSVSAGFYWDIGRENATTGDFVFNNASGAASTERMRITAAGNVGIGTSSPSGKLHVAGGDIFLGASYALKYNSTSYITPENNVSGAEVSTGGVFVVKTGVGPAERLRVDASGNVGIGTSSPKNVLDLGAASLGRGLTFDNFSNIFSSYSAGDLVLSSNFYGSTASDSYLTSTTATFGAAGIRISGTQGGATSGQIQFFANAAEAKTAGAAFTPTERMRITGAGNVGIGTSAPASRLHVQNGALQVSGNSIDTIVSYSTVGIVGTATAHDLQIVRNGAEICRVTANGLTFNGDTAAANALDDYEEGTFTATITPATSGTITSGGAFYYLDLYQNRSASNH